MLGLGGTAHEKVEKVDPRSKEKVKKISKVSIFNLKRSLLSPN